MKRLLCFLLPLLFLTPDVTVGGESRTGEAVTGVRKKVASTRKKKKRKGTRRSYRGRKWKKKTVAKRGTGRNRYGAKRYSGAKAKLTSTRASKSRPGRKGIVRSRRRPASKLPSRSSLATTSGSVTQPKGVRPTRETVVKRAVPPPAPRKPVRLGWRGEVRRSPARTVGGALAPVEEFGDMNSFLQTLPDDGEIRVRYGIYPGPKVVEHSTRFDRERRNVRVSCWLHGVATDSVEGDLTSPVRLLIGSSPDSSLAVFIYARLPGADPARPSAARDSLLGRISPDLAPGLSPTEIIYLTPRPVVLEGALFFNGRRDAGKRYDTGRSRTTPLTVWEIQPVVALEHLVDGRLTERK